MLRCDSIGLDENFIAKGGDSLLAAEMLVRVEQLTGIALPESTLLEATTVRQLAYAISKCIPDARPLLSVQPDGDGHPFFFFHGDLLSGGYYVRRFASLLGNTGFFSVGPHGACRAPIPHSIEQMARDRLPLILAEQAVGPFRLGGYCNGGMVAFECARLLRMAGHQVELLALVDVPVVNAGIVMCLLRHVLTGTLRFPLRDAGEREAIIAECMERIWTLYERARRFSKEPTQPLAKILSKVKLHAELLRALFTRRQLRTHSSPRSGDLFLQKERHYFRALAKYFPGSIDVPIVYYSAEHSGHYLRGKSSQLEIIKLPCDHFSCITTDVRLIAQHLGKRLAGSLV